MEVGETGSRKRHRRPHPPMGLLGGRWRLGDLKGIALPIHAYRGHDGTHDAMLWCSEQEVDLPAVMEDHWRDLPAPWAPLLERQVLEEGVISAHAYVGGVSLA